MKRALIAIASVGILAPAAWTMDANAQQMSPGPAPSQAYAPSQMAPTQAYALPRNERRSPLILSPAPRRGFFFSGRSARHLAALSER
jgi:hypothetical protein